MADTVKRLPLRLTDQDISLDAHRFAYISDRTYTPDEVESMTSTVAETTPEHVKDAPNAKMFLRSLWYRAVMSTLLSADEMHVYTVARWGWHFLVRAVMEHDACLAQALTICLCLQLFLTAQSA